MTFNRIQNLLLASSRLEVKRLIQGIEEESVSVGSTWRARSSVPVTAETTAVHRSISQLVLAGDSPGKFPDIAGYVEQDPMGKLTGVRIVHQEGKSCTSSGHTVPDKGR